MTVRFGLNGSDKDFPGDSSARLSTVLRQHFGLTGTKVGCGTGDCGSCTVLVEGLPVYACLTTMAQVAGLVVQTIEGHGPDTTLSGFQEALVMSGAVQCGFCMPGIIAAATPLLRRASPPSTEEIRQALSGVLCRCTGYLKIIEAVVSVFSGIGVGGQPPTGRAIGARVRRVDGAAKVTGRDLFGADAVPEDALWVRVVRSPHHRASFVLVDLEGFRNRHGGLAAVLTAGDVPFNGYGISATPKDQPVLAESAVRHRGEAVLALVGSREALSSIAEADLPVVWTPHPPVLGVVEAMHPEAERLHAAGNLLVKATVRSGDADAALESAAHVARGHFFTAAVEHAYLEPEAGWAERQGDRLVIHVSTQAPFQDRDEVARILGLRPEQVVIAPTACGGGFGGKLDLSVQPLVALAAWRLGRPVACVYTRAESMAATTKRHPSAIAMELGCDAAGTLVAGRSDALFDTGAYASWGPTVVARVPIHACGPYRYAHICNDAAAWYTNAPPSGAFRGFGVPQAAIAHEALIDDLALEVGIDRLEIRRRNALQAGDLTPTGQRLSGSVGLLRCITALEARWHNALAECDAFNAAGGTHRRGAGIACLWYGIGNTAAPNPSTIRISLSKAGHFWLHSGAVDVGQGANTILSQIAADALGVPLDTIRLASPATDCSPNAGKTSASRQTYVSGKATEVAAKALRSQLLRLADVPESATLVVSEGALQAFDGHRVRSVGLAGLVADEHGNVASAEGSFAPEVGALDVAGQGAPYATYAFGAQMAVVDVDTQLGTVKVLRIVAAHDVGRAINPDMVEGQIHGAVLQGLGMALMESYEPGRTESLRDYLIPGIGEVPAVECLLVEEPEPSGPSGAKGVGEPAIIATAPAILGAVRHATGCRIDRVPVTPERLWRLLGGLA
jgi:aldehyde oxidoreductase